MSSEESQYQPDGDAGARQHETIRQYHPGHVPQPRAERNAHTDLPGPLRDEIRNHAIQAYRRHDQRESAEDREDQRAQPPWTHLSIDSFVQNLGTDVPDAGIRLHQLSAD